MEAELDRIVERIKDAFGIPSVSAAFYVDGKVHTYASGAGENTLFAIASCTKSFTSGVLLSLEEKGALSIEDKIRDYVPGFHLSDPEIEKNLRIKDVLSHRSGLPGADLAWYTQIGTWTQEDLLKAVSLLPKSAELGTKHRYNNMLYALLGQVTETCTGREWKENVRETILRPLGIDKAAFSAREASGVGPVAVPYMKTEKGAEQIDHAVMGPLSPAGSLYMTAADLLKWNVLLLEGGSFGGKNILSPDSVRRMEEPVIPDPCDGSVPALSAVLKDRGYGLGLQTEIFLGEKLVFHGGDIDGFLCQQSILPSKNFAAVLLTDLGGTYAREAFRYAVNGYLLGDKTDWVRAFSELQEKTDAELYKTLQEFRNNTLLPGERASGNNTKDLPGTYRNPLFGKIVVSETENGLSLRFGSVLMAAGLMGEELVLWHPEFGFLYSDVKRDADGTVTGLSVAADPTIPERFFFRKESN